MAHHCTRPGCSAPAVALLSFDPINCHVWIDHFDATANSTDQPLAQVQALCERHADRTTPPRGWTISIHRAVEPPVVDERPDEPSDVDVDAVAEVAVEPESTTGGSEPERVADAGSTRRRRPQSLLGRALSNVGHQRSVLTELDEPES